MPWPRSLITSTLVAAVVVAACSGSTDDAAEAPTTTADATTTTIDVPPVAVPEFPPQPAGVPWPTEEWSVGELPDGVDRAAIDAATDTAFADGADERVRAVAIVHGGQLVYERYSPHRTDGPAEIMPSYSIAKSVTSAAIGILVGDGLLSLDEPAPVPEWHVDPDDPRADITLGQMLHMSTGMPWDDQFDEDGATLNEMLASGDMAAYAAAQEPIAAPGEQFEYNTGTSMILARIVGDTAGGDALAFLDERLFGPIGMTPVHTDTDRAGTWLGGISSDTTAKNYAKFGLLYLRGGEWDGTQVIPRDWVEYSRTPSPTEPEYGAHWWLDPLRPGVSYALGFRGQVITVDPMHDLVIVQLSTIGGPLALDHTEAILDAFADAS